MIDNNTNQIFILFVLVFIIVLNCDDFNRIFVVSRTNGTHYSLCRIYVILNMYMISKGYLRWKYG